MTTQTNGRTGRPRLISGRHMICPRCKTPKDILAFVRLIQIEEYAHETTPLYKCPDCRWVFAPAPIEKSVVECPAGSMCAMRSVDAV